MHFILIFYLLFKLVAYVLYVFYHCALFVSLTVLNTFLDQYSINEVLAAHVFSIILLPWDLSVGLVGWLLLWVNDCLLADLVNEVVDIFGL